MATALKHMKRSHRSQRGKVDFSQFHRHAYLMSMIKSNKYMDSITATTVGEEIQNADSKDNEN